jgi:hypothetical protein
MFACLNLKFHKDLKLLSYFKALLEKPFQTFYYSLKNSFEKIRFQILFCVIFKSYASILAKENDNKKRIISNKVHITKKVFENKILIEFIL